MLSYETVKLLKRFMYYTVRADNSMSNPKLALPEGHISSLGGYLDIPYGLKRSRGRNNVTAYRYFLAEAKSFRSLGISPEYSYICTGSVDVNGQIFNCHKWGDGSFYLACINVHNNYRSNGKFVFVSGVFGGAVTVK